MKMSAAGGVHEIDIRPNKGFNIVSFKMDVAFTDYRAAEQFYADLRRVSDMDIPAILTCDLPASRVPSHVEDRMTELRERVEDLAGQSQSEAQEELTRLEADYL